MLICIGGRHDKVLPNSDDCITAEGTETAIKKILTQGGRGIYPTKGS